VVSNSKVLIEASLTTRTTPKKIPILLLYKVALH